MANWKQRFIDITELIASWSKDKNTKVGAIIVDEDNRIISSGYNGFVAGANDELEERHQRPAKYLFTVHAEANAIYSCAKSGIKTKGCTMVLMWFPCSSCAQAIIQSGIKKLICTKPDFNNERWGDSFKASDEMLKESGIEIEYYEKA